MLEYMHVTHTYECANDANDTKARDTYANNPKVPTTEALLLKRNSRILVSLIY